MEKRGSRYLQFSNFNAVEYVCHGNPVFAAHLAMKRAKSMRQELKQNEGRYASDVMLASEATLFLSNGLLHSIRIKIQGKRPENTYGYLLFELTVFSSCCTI
ncbi:hypothetical protein [Caproicibacter fermentans]|uniref:hypothetical protein n=1 Tax=Caproicibacter fermentans TaxID=2576756 RepID=UPI0012ED2E63|nr:hypothetical protein [Caproicibacter fermentans]